MADSRFLRDQRIARRIHLAHAATLDEVCGYEDMAAAEAAGPAIEVLLATIEALSDALAVIADSESMRMRAPDGWREVERLEEFARAALSAYEDADKVAALADVAGEVAG